MSDSFDEAKERVLAEYWKKVNGRTGLSFQETMELREYAKSRTDLKTEQLTPEQAVWKWLYESLTDELRSNFPDSMPKIEELEARREDLEALRETIEVKLTAHPKDYGVRFLWGFGIIGLLVGWERSPDLGSILVYGLAFWIGGLLFCIFALDSAAVQSRTAIFLNKRLGMKRIASWLYERALTIR